MSVRHAVGAYFSLQGLAVALWWLLLLVYPTSRDYYFRMGDSEATLLAFWLPDLFLLATGSLLAAYLCFIDSSHTQVVLFSYAGPSAMPHCTVLRLPC
ncbi:MAG TPA: hypothetical protein VF600_10790 [Abditibacteriaceae bacterium]|jgi:hypothetical protein